MTSKNYKVNSRQQLIDLNGPLTNFEVSYFIKPKESIQIALVNQTILDSGVSIDFQTTDKEISNTFREDSGQYQNHFLLIKADSPTTVVVDITRKEIPERMTESKPLPVAQQYHSQPHQSYLQVQVPMEPWKKALIGLVVVSIIYFGFKYQQKCKL